jgi:hypothetical protein
MRPEDNCNNWNLDDDVFLWNYENVELPLQFTINISSENLTQINLESDAVDFAALHSLDALAASLYLI